MNWKAVWMRVALALVVVLLLAPGVWAGKKLGISTASVYQSSVGTLGSGSALCTNIDVASEDTSCGTAFNTGYSYRFEFIAENTGSKDADVDRIDFRNVFKSGSAIGDDAVLVECGCYEGAANFTGSFSTNGDDVRCSFSSPDQCTLLASGDTDEFYFVITLGSSAGADSDPKFYVKSGGSNKTSKKLATTLAVCGNDTKEGLVEVCDGTDLNAQTCVLQGFDSGNLACNSDCLDFNVLSCVQAPPVVNGESETDQCGIGCCGGGSCDADFGEDFGTCRSDCQTPRNLFFTVLSPRPEDVFAAGDVVTVKVQLQADSVLALFADDVTVHGKFGNVALVDSGEGADETKGDGIYSASFVVGEAHTTRVQPLFFRARVEKTWGAFESGYRVVPALAINFETNKKTYSLGDVIRLNGRVVRNNAPVALDLNLSIVALDQNTLIEQTVHSDASGAFSSFFQTSQLHPSGEWKLTVHGVDDMNNFGFLIRDINVFVPNPRPPLSVLLADKLSFVQREKQTRITVDVLDEYSEHVEDANVALVFPTGETVSLTETPNKKYAGFFVVPFDMAAQNQEFVVRVKKETPFSVASESKRFVLTVKEAPIRIDILEPVQSSFNWGDTVLIRVRLTYENGEPVMSPVVSAFVGSQAVILKATDLGVYEGHYVLLFSDVGKTNLAVKARDAYSNFGEAQTGLFVAPYLSPQYFVAQRPLLSVLGAVGMLVMLVGVGLVLQKRSALQTLSRNKVDLEAKRAQLAKSYYKDQVLSREDFVRLSSEIEMERDMLEARLNKKQKKR